MSAGLTISTQEQSYATVQISQLRTGSRLRAPIYEDRPDQNVLLLAAGTTVTPAILAKLQQRGVATVRVLASELERLTSGRIGPAETPAIQRSNWNTALANVTNRSRPASEDARFAGLQEDAFLRNVQFHGTLTFDEKRIHQFSAKYDKSVLQIADLVDGLARGGTVNGSAVTTVSADSIVQMADDMDLFVTLGITPRIDRYPYRHSLQTSMLAMAIGAVMGLREESLLEMGMGCLVHDAGMLKINQRVFESNQDLDRIQFLEITKHPMYTFELVRNLTELPIGARMVAYQMHERWNGSGYPCRKQGQRIHPLARIAAVADVFVAMISARPHRPGMLPCHAMEQVIRGVSQGLYDPEVVRALLYTVSLFPLGSFVEMNDGRVGKVVRANREEYTRPIVELWPDNAPQYGSELVDLSRETRLQVVRPLAGPHRPRRS